MLVSQIQAQQLSPLEVDQDGDEDPINEESDLKWHLSHYILLIKWTEQGISKINESPDRFSSFKAMLEKVGGKLIGGYYTFGEYDVVIVMEAPKDEAAMSLMLKVGSAGNVRTKTLKAFTAEEGIKIIKDLQ
jgi:uncharacterized protein with GYD domain